MHSTDPEKNLTKYRNKKTQNLGVKDQKRSQDRLSCHAPWESPQEPKKDSLIHEMNFHSFLDLIHEMNI